MSVTKAISVIKEVRADKMRLMRFPCLLFIVCCLLVLCLQTQNDPGAIAQEWAPSWQLPQRDRPANIIEAPITGRGEMPEGRFFPPIICGACHTDIFQQWKGSTHAYAWYDPLPRALYQKGLQEDRKSTRLNSS